MPIIDLKDGEPLILGPFGCSVAFAAFFRLRPKQDAPKLPTTLHEGTTRWDGTPELGNDAVIVERVENSFSDVRMVTRWRIKGDRFGGASL